MPRLAEDPMLSITSLALFLVLGIISFPAKKNITDYNVNSSSKWKQQQQKNRKVKVQNDDVNQSYSCLFALV